MKIYLHMNVGQRGNRGMLMLTDLAGRLKELGHEVAAFHHEDKLTPQHFAWMHPLAAPELISVEDVLKSQGRRHYVILTVWVSNWLKTLEAHPEHHSHIAYWEWNEQIRIDKGDAQHFVRERLNARIALNNARSVAAYEDIGYEATGWPAWVPSLFFCEHPESEQAKLAYYLAPDKELEMLERRFPDLEQNNETHWELDLGDKVLGLELSKYFIYYPIKHEMLLPCRTLDYPMLEAVACGCYPFIIGDVGPFGAQYISVAANQIAQFEQDDEKFQAAKTKVEAWAESLRWSDEHAKVIEGYLDGFKRG